MNTRFSMGKPFKDKNPKALIIHPLNEMTEFVHEQRNFVHRTLRWMYIKISKTKRALAGLLLLSFCCCHMDCYTASTSIESVVTSRMPTTNSARVCWWTGIALIGLELLKYCNFEEYSICIVLWSPMVLSGEPLILLCTPILLIGRTNKSHEAVPSNCKGGSLAPQCGYLSLHD